MDKEPVEILTSPAFPSPSNSTMLKIPVNKPSCASRIILSLASIDIKPASPLPTVVVSMNAPFRTDKDPVEIAIP